MVRPALLFGALKRTALLVIPDTGYAHACVDLSALELIAHVGDDWIAWVGFAQCNPTWSAAQLEP